MRKKVTLNKDLFDFSSIWQMLRIVWNSSKKLTILRFSLQFFQSILPLIPIYLLKLLLDAFVDKDQYSFDYIVWILVGFAVVKILNILIANIANYVAMLQSDIVIDYMSNIVISKAIHTDLEYFDVDAYHDVYQRALGQQGRPLQVLGLVTRLMQTSTSLLAIVGLLFTLHWGVALILFFIALPTAFIRWHYAEKTVRLREKQTPIERKAGYYRSILTNTQYAKEVRVFAYGKSLLDKFLKIRKTIRKENRNLYVNQSKSMGIAQSLEAVAIIGALGLIARRAFDGLLSVGDIAMYYQLFQKGQSNINSLLGTIVAVQENKLYIQHLFDFLELQPKIVDPPNPKNIPQQIEELTVQNIHFTYPKTTRKVIDNVSFSVKKGEILAIVGENGSGKTTLVKLLNRLYDQQQGRIQLNGIDTTEFELAPLRKKITVIFQQFAKYFTTVRENIEFADMQAVSTPKNLEQAAQFAGANGFIAELPQQFETQLGRSFLNGEELSGGQWQKIALSRAFYKEAGIIILDEPTSFIDPIAEDEIFTNLRTVAKNKILILITHRIYNLKMCDRILVMDKGKLVEIGNHEELIAQQGLYHKMFEKQS